MIFQFPLKMKKITVFYCLFFTVFVFSQSTMTTKKNPSPFTKHGITLIDDYAWLENTKSEDVANWVDTQNKNTKAHLEEINLAKSIAVKIREYDRLTAATLPDKKGKYFYKMYRKDNTTPAYLTYRKSLNDFPTEIVNSYKIYNDPTVFINGYYPSKSSKYLATKFNINGSDKNEVRFYNLTTGTNPLDILKNIKYSNVEWNEDDGVFYKKNSNTEVFAKDSTNQLYYHKMGESQDKDVLVFDTSKSETTFSFFTSRGRLFVVEKNKEETLKKYYSASLKVFPFKLEKFIEDKTQNFEFISYRNNRVYFSSGKYDWGEIRSMDINNPKDETVVIPQIYNHLLVGHYFLDDYIVCKYKTLGKNYLIVYENSGAFLKRIEVPGGVDFRFKFYDPETKNLYVSFFSRTLPNQNYTINLLTGEANPFYNDFIKPKPTIFPLNYFETKSLTFKSRDGKDVPISIVYKKGIPLDGNNPTLLEAYGGFGNISSPDFESGLLYFLEKGGIYAFAEIRGGGEKGINWHKDGKGIKKINGFNDFIDAAEFLIREKYTSSNKLGISGGSHGGLVVGVAMTQRPDLFKVAIPVAGVFDMAKYNLFTTGQYHLDEFGNPDNKPEYEALLTYSPYHNIKEDVNYPTTLILAGENDDRVTPFQSYKFAAKLQNRAAQKNPVYINVLKKAGHNGRGQTYDGRIESQSEYFSFLLYHLNK